MGNRERWRELKRQAYRRARGRCEFCGVVLGKFGDWHLHHLTYERRGHELLDDLRAICLACHGEQHPQYTFRTVDEQKRIRKRRRFHLPKSRPSKQPPLTAEARKARYQSAGRKFG